MIELKVGILKKSLNAPDQVGISTTAGNSNCSGRELNSISLDENPDRGLRVRTTSEHYSDSTARVTPGVGHLLVNVYVQVTVTAQDPNSGQMLRNFRRVFVEVPRARIERYRKESPKIAADTADERLSEDLAGDVAPYALGRIPDPPPGPWRVDKVALSGYPSEIEGRQHDLSFDSMKAWFV